MNQIVLKRRLSDVVEEYEHKASTLTQAIEAHTKTFSDLMMHISIEGTYGQENIKSPDVDERKLQSHLKKSAWIHLYQKLEIKKFASVNEQKKFEKFFENPDEFTMENIRAQFADYIADPRGKMLHALAEAFCNLDPSFKSHDKVKIGVAGLPKRVIIPYFSGTYSSGKLNVTAIMNALATYQGIPLPSDDELRDLRNGTIDPARGMRLKIFQNNNAHLFFTPSALLDVNRALAEYYGEVLADSHEEKPEKRRESTEVSKDLQYYPTPISVIKEIFSRYELKETIKGKKVLEPSCGCGRILDQILRYGGNGFGIEYDKARAMEARAKGHNVYATNFLEVEPDPNDLYDMVIMNPPFYGKHYAKHIKHAMRFLKPGGTIYAIVPVTARYDHGLLPVYPKRRGYDEAHEETRNWFDLPTGSFTESGTRINTSIYRYTVPKEQAERMAA